jgi:hypothetical protein
VRSYVRQLAPAGALCVVACVSSGRPVPSANPCRPPDELSQLALAQVWSVATSPAEPSRALRASVGLERVGPERVELSQDALVCGRAADAVMQATGAPDAATAPLRPYVVRVGSHYIALDPDVRAGERTPACVLDDRFTVVGWLML